MMRSVSATDLSTDDGTSEISPTTRRRRSIWFPLCHIVRMRLTHVGVGLLAILTLMAAPACGTESTTGSEQTFESWHDSACAVLRSNIAALDAAPTDPPADTEEFFATTMRPAAEAMRRLAAELREIPLPDDRRVEAERFVELSEALSKRYAEALPRLEEASRRWDRVLKSIDPGTLPPPREGQTAVQATMAQLLSVPAAKEAWDDMRRLTNTLSSNAEAEESERLTKELRLEACEAEAG
jgi:hypothetical protein